MSAAVMTQSPAVYAPSERYRLTGLGLLRSEWTKFWSLRSSWIVMICAALFGAGIGVAVSFEFRGMTVEQVAVSGMGPLDMLFGYSLSSVFIAVLGALFITGEYSTGSIHSTIAAAPRRTGVLWAKAAVFGAIVIAVHAVLILATYAVSQAILDGSPLGGASLSDPGMMRVLVGYLVYNAYLGLLGLMIGAILRNSAGSIAFYIGIVLVLPMLLPQLPWQWAGDIAPYLPGSLAENLTDTAAAPLGIGTTWAWLGVWMVAAAGLAAVLLKRRDV